MGLLLCFSIQVLLLGLAALTYRVIPETLHQSYHCNQFSVYCQPFRESVGTFSKAHPSAQERDVGAAVEGAAVRCVEFVVEMFNSSEHVMINLSGQSSRVERFQRTFAGVFPSRLLGSILNNLIVFNV